jgi:5-methylcytosine-specific restriction endonuclease McrA
MTAYHRTPQWQAFARQMRKRINPLLPLPCVECGRPVEREDAWHVAHLVAAVLDPFQPLTPEGVGPAHRHCNQSDGGRLGRARQLAKRRDDKGLPPEGSGW